MAKQPPSFPFYTGDWIAGTATMSLADKGAYIDCLAHQWGSDEGVPGDDPVSLARIIRATPAEARRVWAVIGRKFDKSDDGLYRNARVERERATKARYYASKSENGSKGGRPVKTETKPIGLAPSPSPSPSVPNGTASTRPARPNPYAHAQVQAPNGRVFWEGPIFSIPDGWARRVLNASNGKAVGSDVVKFAQALTAKLQRDGGEAPTAGFLGWLDTEWAAYRQPAVSDGYRPASEWIEQNRKASEGSCSPEEARAILAEARAKMRPVAHHG